MYTINKNPLHLKNCVNYKNVLVNNFYINSSSNKTPAFICMSNLFYSAI